MKPTLLLVALATLLATGMATAQDVATGCRQSTNTRTYPVTDKAFARSLNGVWHIKVTNGIAAESGVPDVDSTWTTIPVPGCWEQYGLCSPRYSFPDSLTGYYRRTFLVPESWRGKRVLVRTDGVLRGYELWINGQKVGRWESAYNTRLFDITPMLTRRAFRGEPQQLAMKVYSVYKGYEFDCFDDWAPMGIFRDVTLMAVPDIHLADLTVTTDIEGRVSVRADVANANRHTDVRAIIRDADGLATPMVKTASGTLEATLENPQLWTAETPYLYTLSVELLQKGTVTQTVTEKIGLRQLTIGDNHTLMLNGKPVKLRGVTLHATHPESVKVISEELTLKDMMLMKEASVNYIRTSHYPREPRFYELADSLGFYIIDEVPFGSRGEKHLTDTTYADILRSRAEATILRDKNHPSVLIWSLGNENPLTDISVEVGRYAKQLDPTRMICYPQKGSYFRSLKYHFPTTADIYAPHYPTTAQLADFYQRADRPVIFTEYCHTLGISFEDHDRQWEIIERTPALAGGSVWEWVDQGMPFRAPLTERFGYEERVFTSTEGGFQMFGEKGTDGLLYADRTPLPNYYELQHNYAVAAVVDTLCGDTLHIRNRYDFLNLRDNVDFHWALTADRDTIARGSFSPDCPPRSTVGHPLPLPPLPPQAWGLLHIEVKNRQGQTMLRQAVRVKGNERPHLDFSQLRPMPDCGDRDWGEWVQTGPLVRVGRKPTMCEKMKLGDDRVARYLQPLVSPYATAVIHQQDGQVDYVLTPDTTRRILTEFGVAYLLSPRFDRVQWVGLGPYATYPGRRQANRYGYWALHKDDLYFEGNRMGCEAVWVSDADGNGVLFDCAGGNVNFEQTDRGIVITVNAAVAGQGPKFSRTAFGTWSDKIGEQTGAFRLFVTRKGDRPDGFASPHSVKPPLRPFLTQYDTYLMRFDDITPAPSQSREQDAMGND